MNEARDVVEFGGFRVLDGVGYEDGKWFAASFADAVRWGRAFQRFSQPRPFQVAAARVPRALLAEIEFHARWDAIGPAYYVGQDQLPALNRASELTISTVFDPE